MSAIILAVTISGFTFVRNAVRYDFPLAESLRSLAPLCDEIVIALGRSDDGTPDVIRALGEPKVRVIETVWDDALREGGRVYAQQTDLALAACRGDWCVYLQADEVLHEDDIEPLRREIERADADPRVDALLFRYLHFYGSYDYLGAGRQWYRREVRAVRNTRRVISWGDAQGFRTRSASGDAEHLTARQTDIRVFHYGWVRDPAVQARKQREAHRFWHDDAWIEEHLAAGDFFDYDSAHDLERYTGSHPAVMNERRAAAAAWASSFDPKRLRPKPLLMRITDAVEKWTGWRIGEYRNFREV